MTVTGVWARIDRGGVREHLVDANDGIIASAGIIEGLLGAGASSTILLVASLAAMVGGGLALGGMRYAEAADERDARSAKDFHGAAVGGWSEGERAGFS